MFEIIRTIKNAVLWVSDFFTSVFEFLVNIFRDIASIASLLGSAVSSIPSYLHWFPAAFTAIIITLISIAVAYKILGREG